MKIKSLELINFKRFTNLKINVGNEEVKLVVLVGPNGSGKSSIFDAFEQIGGRNKPNVYEDQIYLKKNQSQNWDASIETDHGIYSKTNSPPVNAFYLRSSYRYEPDFGVNTIQSKDNIVTDSKRPKRMIDMDQRVQDNYERLVEETINGIYSGKKDNLKVEELREELIGNVRNKMKLVFPDLNLVSINNPMVNGYFSFTKGTAQNFHYKNLSAGEKSAFDILFDFLLKSEKFNDTVFAIDEPELHMHSKLQRDLLKTIYNILPNSCQLWVATHSIGFLREAIDIQKDNKEGVVILNFNEIDFDREQIIEPLTPSTANVRKIFDVAIEDLSQMVSPSKIVICEGSLNESKGSTKRDFDTKIYNKIFKNEDILFISGDCKSTAQKSASLLFKIIKDSGLIREISSIVDRDQLTAEMIQEYKKRDPSQNFLSRRSIENFIFDSEIIDRFCDTNGIDKTKVTTRITDPINQDTKQIQSAIMQQCGFSEIDDFKLILAEYILPSTRTYSDLRKDIFI